jgi:hypothetical protein
MYVTIAMVEGTARTIIPNLWFSPIVLGCAAQALEWHGKMNDHINIQIYLDSST